MKIKGKKYFKDNKKPLKRIQLYVRLTEDEELMLNKFVHEKYKHTKSIWLRKVILDALINEYKKLKKEEKQPIIEYF